MKGHCESGGNRPQGSETALKSVYFASQSFPLLLSVKTCPINAPQRIFPKHLIPEYPPQIRRIGGSDYFQNDSFSRCRSRGHAKSRSRTVSSYAEAGRLRPLLIESLADAVCDFIHRIEFMGRREGAQEEEPE